MPNGDQDKTPSQEETLDTLLKQWGVSESDIPAGSLAETARFLRRSGQHAAARREEVEMVAGALWQKKLTSATLESPTSGRQLPRQGVITIFNVKNLLDRMMAILPMLVEDTAEIVGEGEFWGANQVGDSFQGIGQSAPLEDLFTELLALVTPRSLDIEAWKGETPGPKYIRSVKDNVIGEYGSLFRGVAEESFKVLGNGVLPYELLQIDEAVTDLMVYWSAPELYDAEDLERASIELLGYIHGRAMQIVARLEDRLATDFETLGINMANTTLPVIDNAYIIHLSEAQLFQLGLIPGRLDFVTAQEAAGATGGDEAFFLREFGRAVPVFKNERDEIIKVGLTFEFSDRLREQLTNEGILPLRPELGFPFVTDTNIADNLTVDEFIISLKRKTILSARENFTTSTEDMILMVTDIVPVGGGPIRRLPAAARAARNKAVASGIKHSPLRSNIARDLFIALDENLTPLRKANVEGGILAKVERRVQYEKMKELQAIARNVRTEDQFVDLFKLTGDAYLAGLIERRNAAVIFKHLGGGSETQAVVKSFATRGGLARIASELETDPRFFRSWYDIHTKPVGPSPNFRRPALAKPLSTFRESTAAARANRSRFVQEIQRLRTEFPTVVRPNAPTINPDFSNLLNRAAQLERNLVKNPSTALIDELDGVYRQIQDDAARVANETIAPFSGTVAADRLASISDVIRNNLVENVALARGRLREMRSVVAARAGKVLTTTEANASEEVADSTRRKFKEAQTEQVMQLQNAEQVGKVRQPRPGSAPLTGPSPNPSGNLSRVLVERAPLDPQLVRLEVMESSVLRMADRGDFTVKRLDAALGVGRFIRPEERVLIKEFEEMGGLIAALKADPGDIAAFEALAAKITAIPEKIVEFERLVDNIAPSLSAAIKTETAAIRQAVNQTDQTIDNIVDTILERSQFHTMNPQDMQKVMEAQRQTNSLLERILNITKLKEDAIAGRISAAARNAGIVSERAGFIAGLKAAGGWRRIAGQALNGPMTIWRVTKGLFPLFLFGFAVQQMLEFLVWGPSIYGDLSGEDLFGFGRQGTKRARFVVNGLITVDRSMSQAVQARAWDLAAVNLRNYEINVELLAALIRQNQQSLANTNMLAEFNQILINHQRAIEAWRARIEKGQSSTAAKRAKFQERAKRPASTAQVNYVKSLVTQNRVKLTAQEQTDLDAGRLTNEDAGAIIDRKDQPFQDNDRGDPTEAPKWQPLENTLDREEKNFQNRDEPTGGKPGPGGPRGAGAGARPIT